MFHFLEVINLIGYYLINFINDIYWQKIFDFGENNLKFGQICLYCQVAFKNPWSHPLGLLI